MALLLACAWFCSLLGSRDSAVTQSPQVQPGAHPPYLLPSICQRAVPPPIRLSLQLSVLPPSLHPPPSWTLSRFLPCLLPSSISPSSTVHPPPNLPPRPPAFHCTALEMSGKGLRWPKPNVCFHCSKGPSTTGFWGCQGKPWTQEPCPAIPAWPNLG